MRERERERESEREMNSQQISTNTAQIRVLRKYFAFVLAVIVVFLSSPTRAGQAPGVIKDLGHPRARTKERKKEVKRFWTKSRSELVGFSLSRARD